MEYVYSWSTSAPVASFTSNRKLQNLNSAAQYIYHTFVVNMYHVLLNIIEKFLCVISYKKFVNIDNCKHTLTSILSLSALW